MTQSGEGSPGAIRRRLALAAVEGVVDRHAEPGFQSHQLGETLMVVGQLGANAKLPEFFPLPVHLPFLLQEARGGARRDVVPIAAVGMLAYLGADMLDEVMDGDEPEYGLSPPELVMTGSGFLGTLPYLLLSEIEAEDAVKLELIQEYARGVVQMGAGQALDVGLTDGRLSGAEPILECARLKSGAMLAALCRMVGILGGGGAEQVAAYGDYGEAIGTAIQLRGDMAEAVKDSGGERNAQVLGVLMGTLDAVPIVAGVPDQEKPEQGEMVGDKIFRMCYNTAIESLRAARAGADEGGPLVEVARSSCLI